jgi:hypothetical protein
VSRGKLLLPPDHDQGDSPNAGISETLTSQQAQPFLSPQRATPGFAPLHMGSNAVLSRCRPAAVGMIVARPRQSA